jgi:hypothetical protein
MVVFVIVKCFDNLPVNTVNVSKYKKKVIDRSKSKSMFRQCIIKVAKTYKYLSTESDIRNAC